MSRPTVLICIDGLDPAYLDAGDTPVLDEIGKSGFSAIGRSMMPSVTNVNNVSIVTGRYPDSHGIGSNYRLVRETSEEIYMESAEYIQSETIFERAASRGLTSILVTAKDKLRTLLGEGATVAVSSERPPDELVDSVGRPPGIYTVDVNAWVIGAATWLMSQHPADIVYISTTDYAMHTYAPEEPEARRHTRLLDSALGRLADTHPDATVLVTADHGMSRKSRMVDIRDALAVHGIVANPVPIIKDRYVVHHSNLGGCIYIYLESGDVEAAVEALRDIPGVEEALTREQAAQDLRLPHDRIGDVVVTGEPDVVFGDAQQVALPRGLRSHGSAHERRVPIIGYNGDFDGFTFEENRDIGRYVFERALA